MARVIVFVDGFNLYHSLHDLDYSYIKWLDLMAVSKRIIQPVTENIVDVYYFSAYPNWKTDSKTRHIKYVNALQTVGVKTIMGHFKVKNVECHSCGAKWEKHEEKETDVNIALYMLNLAYKNEYDTAILVSRDSDLTPAVKTIKQEFPHKKIITVCPPFTRHSNELLTAATSHRKISFKQILECQFKDDTHRPVEYKKDVQKETNLLAGKHPKNNHIKNNSG